MPSFTKIVVFFLVNALGFFSPGVLYVLGKLTGAISPDDPAFDAVAFQQWFLTGTMMTWIVCALFSLSYFFLKGKAKLFFLWAPAVVPYVYGLSVLFAA
jgi:hypothetical protein